MIIDASYFVGDIHLPQVGAGSSSKVNNTNKALDFVDKYEADILVKGLGRKTYNEFYSAFEDGKLKDDADEKWNRLLNGHEYDEKSWRGLIDVTGSLKESLIAYYAYYMYLSSSLTVLTAMGTKQGKSQNTTAADPTSKMVNAWRQLHKWYEGTDSVFYAHYFDRGVEVEDFYGGNNSNEVSLKQFLSDNRTDYPDYRFSSIGHNMNVFGI